MLKMTRLKYTQLLAVALVFATYSANALYKCTVDGKAMYQAAPCQDETGQTVIRDYTPPTPKDNNNQEISQIIDDPETPALVRACNEAKTDQPQDTTSLKARLDACTRLQEHLENKDARLRAIQLREEELAKQARKQLRELEGK